MKNLRDIIREEIKYIVETEMPRVVAGNVGDTETDKELAAIRQGIQTGDVSDYQLEMLSSILSHTLKHALGNVDMWVQMAQHDSEQTKKVDHVKRAIEVLKKGEQRLGELVIALTKHEEGQTHEKI